MSSVKRYNELARLGKDLDFGKPSYMLTTIEKAPFYAVKSGAALAMTDSGLEINTKLQVLDKEKRIIQGLYAAGDASGASSHKFSSGSFTEGRIAGKAAIVDIQHHLRMAEYCAAPARGRQIVHKPAPVDFQGAFPP